MNVTSSNNQSENVFIISQRSKESNNKSANGDNSKDNHNVDESEFDDIVLSVNFKNNNFGAAYFNINNSELFIMDEIPDRRPEHHMLCNLFRQTRPVRVITEGRFQNSFMQCLKGLTRMDDTNASSTTKLCILPAREYSYEACRRRLSSLSLPSEPKNCSDEERLVYLRTLLNFSQIQSIHALGALIKYLDGNWSNLTMDKDKKPEFMSIKRISLIDIVSMNDEAYTGLQIFNTISHPSNFKQGTVGSNKEGLSIFRLFNNCRSSSGSKLLRVLMQHPTRDLQLIKRRLDVIDFCMQTKHEDHIQRICSSLRFIKNINGIITKIKSLTAVPYQWKSLYNTLYNAVLICEICKTCSGCSLIEELGSCDNNDLYEVARCMTHIIDFELSKSQDKFTVKAGVDPELDKKKQVMASLHGLMSNTAKCEMDKLPSFIEECTMVYIPHLGYLLGVKSWADDLSMSQKELPNLKFMFQNHDYIHYKSKGCEELDIMIGDTYPEIMAHETRIMMRLTDIILDNLTSLNAIIEKCAELDCLIAISKACKELNFNRPKLTSNKVINIKQGWHPLHQINQENFVPNDTKSSCTDGYLKILTGPNASGKSVYLKQIAIITYLAHIGSFVPAEYAEIGLINQMFTRINCVESVALHMSAFLIDLRQIALALHDSDSNSLVIIDEFGKGTSEVDGLALLAASLNTFLSRDEDCPHVFVSTHFLNIANYILETPYMKLQTMEHIIKHGELVFLYRIIDGSTSSSYANEVASVSGIHEQIIKRAKHVRECWQEIKLPEPNQKVLLRIKGFLDIETLKRRL